jgi:UDP-2,3-diacylglucosamine pyrophosphatase LpxH
MIVVISDIHFVDGTAGEHNLPYSAFKSVFLSDIAELAKEKGAKEVKILLLGDIIDLIRSTKWFEVDMDDRPWGNKGLEAITRPRKGTVTEKQCLKILGKVSERSLNNSEPPRSLPRNTILHKNWHTFKLFRDLNTNLDKNIPVKVIYVPGNHDRLCNLYPSVRDALRKQLGLTVEQDTVDGDPNAEWWYKQDFLDEDHGLYARHGHQFDIWNFGGGNDHTRLGHLQAAIGDVFTTEFAVKIPWMLDRVRAEFSEVTPEIVETTKDIDNVRPLSAVMEWIYYKIKREDHDKVREAFEEVFDRIIKELLDISFVQRWRSPYTYIDEALRTVSSRWLSWLPKGLVDLMDAEDLLPLIMGMTGGPEDPEKDVYTRAAYNESIWKKIKGIHFILYGHTHRPLQHPLDVEDGREVFYINTGTWRNRIHKTVALDKAPDFIDLKQMTYTILYRRDEDTSGKKGETLSFDVWTGVKKKHYGREGP